MALTDLPLQTPYGFISVWLKGNSVFPSTGGSSYLLCCYDNRGGSVFAKHLVFRLDPSSGSTCNVTLAFGAISFQSDPVPIVDGNWHHVMVSWDFSGSSLVLNMYVDNVPAGSFNSAAILAPYGIRCGDRSFIIGNCPEFNNGGGDLGYYGSMASLFVLMDQPIDITDPAIREKFIQTSAGIA